MEPQRNHKSPRSPRKGHPNGQAEDHHVLEDRRQMAAARLEMGRRGEAVAARWLVHHGFRLLAKNWRSGRLELDLLAQDPRLPGSLVVVEVKTWRVAHGSLDRPAGPEARPESAISKNKQRRLGKAGRAALAAFPAFCALRFDWIAIRVDGRRCRLLHLPDAFFPS